MIRSGTGRVCATLATVGVVLALWPATAAQAAPAPLSFEATTGPFNGSYPPVSGGLAVDRFVGGTGKDQATDFTLGDGDTQGGTVR